MRRSWLGSAILVATLAGFSSASASDPATVTIQTFQFRPVPLEVPVGTRVTWVNADDITHTITSGTPENPDGRFNFTLAGKDATFSFTFTQPGDFPYFCDRHHSMRGEIRVK